MIEEYIEKLQDNYLWYTTNISNDGMAMSLKLASFMYLLCEKFKFKMLMDRGSGFGSYVLRRYAKEQDFDVQVFSIDDIPEWLEKTKKYLEMHELSIENLYLWKNLDKNLKFDFILEDANRELRLNTSDQMVSMINEDGIILWDDIHYKNSHRPLMKRQAAKLKMNEYDIKEITEDSYGRYGGLITRKNIDWLKK